MSELIHNLCQPLLQYSLECTSRTTRPSEPVLPVPSKMEASVSGIQEQLEKLGPSDVKYQPLLRELLNHQDLKPYVQSLHGPSLEGFVDLLDKVSKVDISRCRC